MRNLTKHETDKVSGAGTDEARRKMYSEDLKKMMNGRTPDQIAKLPGFKGANHYGGYSFNLNGATFTVGPGSYKLDVNPPKSFPSVGVEVKIPIQ